MVIQLCGQTDFQAMKISVDLNEVNEDLPINYRFIFRHFQTQRASKEKIQSEQALTDSIRLVCLRKSAIVLYPCFLDDPEAFVAHLSNISEGHIFECSTSIYSNCHGDNPLWFSSFSFNSLAQWICSKVERMMVLQYQKTRRDLSFRRTMFQESNCLTLAKEFVDFCNKRSSVDLQSPEVWIQNVGQWMDLKMSQTTHKQIEEFQRVSQRMVQLFDEQKTKTLFDDFDQLLTSKKRTKKHPKSCRTNRKQGDIIRTEEQRGLGSVQNGDDQPLQKSQPPQQVCEVNNNHISNQSDQTTESANEDRVEEEEPKFIQSNKPAALQFEYSDLVVDQSQLEGQTLDLLENAETTLSHSVSGSEEIKRKKKHAPKKKKKASDKVVDTLFPSWLDASVEGFVDSLSIESNKLLEPRVLVFQRIRHLVSTMNPGCQIDAFLFGSNAVGLSLVTSDIDILLRGFGTQTSHELVQLLQRLSFQLKQMRWVIDCSIYPLAKVPIIKLLIDPNIRYIDSYHLQPQLMACLQGAGDFLQLKKPVESLINVDITIDTKNAEHSHLGCLSTTFMRNCLQKYQYLHPIVLSLKYLLTKKQLNKPYKGGLSSYGLLIICTAFLKTYPQNSLSEAFLNVLKFYSTLFRNQEQAIHMQDQSQCYVDLPTKAEGEKGIPLSIIDPLNKKLMSANCLQFCKIQEQFSQVYQKLMLVKDFFKKQVCELQPAELKSLQQKKKVSQRFVRRYQKLHKIKDIMDSYKLYS